MKSRAALWPWAELLIAAAACAAIFFWPAHAWLALACGAIPWAARMLRRDSPPLGLPDALLAAFLLSAFISLWAAYDPASAFQKFYLLIGAALLYYSLANQPKANLWPALSAIGLTGGLITTLFLLAHTGDAFAAIPNLRQVLSANYVGGANAILLPLLAAVTGRHWRGGRRGLAAANALLLAYLGLGLLISGSRAGGVAALIGLGVMAALLAAPQRAIARLSQPVFLAAIAAPILVGLVGPALLAGWLTPRDVPITEMSSFGSRPLLARETWLLISDFPFTGGGLAAFAGLYAEYVRLIPHHLFSYSHNLSLDLLLEQGVPGFLLWTGVIFGMAAPLRAALQAPPREGQPKLLAAALSGSLFILLIHGILDDPLYSNFWGLPLLFALPGIARSLAGGAPDPKVVRGPWGARAAVGLAALGLILLALPPVRAAWHANWGALYMAKAELAGWPSGEWLAAGRAALPARAEAAFGRALALDARQPTAHYRLGLVWLARGDFARAAPHLEAAQAAAPGHRGIQKALGYCYAWLGETERAKTTLVGIPEARAELWNYVSWWQARGRADLAEHAAQVAEQLTE